MDDREIIHLAREAYKKAPKDSYGFCMRHLEAGRIQATPRLRMILVAELDWLEKSAS